MLRHSRRDFGDSWSLVGAVLQEPFPLGRCPRCGVRAQGVNLRPGTFNAAMQLGLRFGGLPWAARGATAESGLDPCELITEVLP